MQSSKEGIFILMKRIQRSMQSQQMVGDQHFNAILKKTVGNQQILWVDITCPRGVAAGSDGLLRGCDRVLIHRDAPTHAK